MVSLRLLQGHCSITQQRRQTYHTAWTRLPRRFVTLLCEMLMQARSYVSAMDLEECGGSSPSQDKGHKDQHQSLKSRKMTKHHFGILLGLKQRRAKGSTRRAMIKVSRHPEAAVERSRTVQKGR